MNGPSASGGQAGIRLLDVVRGIRRHLVYVRQWDAYDGLDLNTPPPGPPSQILSGFAASVSASRSRGPSETVVCATIPRSAVGEPAYARAAVSKAAPKSRFRCFSRRPSFETMGSWTPATPGSRPRIGRATCSWTRSLRPREVTSSSTRRAKPRLTIPSWPTCVPATPSSCGVWTGRAARWRT